MRLTTSEVCAMGRFSTATLWRRVRYGRLPKPIDHAREALFDADAIHSALGSKVQDAPTLGSGWAVDPKVLTQACSGKTRTSSY